MDDFFTATESFLEGASISAAATDDFFLEAHVVDTSEATLPAAD